MTQLSDFENQAAAPPKHGVHDDPLGQGDSRKSATDLSDLRRNVFDMEEPAPWPALDGTRWQQRVREAEAIGEQWGVPDLTDEDDDQAQRWLASIDPTAYVGSRHHTVPRFLLERWADKNGQVRTYHRIEARYGIENIRDLAVTDFYTVIDNDGRKNSALESLMGVVEASTKPHIDAILNPFSRPAPIGTAAMASLAQFATFQSTRTTRRRREIELQAEWYAKTMATGRVPDDELQTLTVVPHQNETIQLASTSAQKLLPYFVCRPLAIVKLGAPLLYMCDEPVVLNAAVGEIHTPDCFLTDQEVEARRKRTLRKTKKRKRDRHDEIRGRTIHFSSTMPRGHGVADEILLAISPSTALLWGPLTDRPQAVPAERVTLDTAEAIRFANMANDAMCAQALDWVITRIDDANFKHRTFPKPGPLMRVCDGTNAASIAINEIPARFRPHRLWTPDPE